MGADGTDDDTVPGNDESEIARDVAGDPEGFLGLMGHFYRGEMARTTTWRARLDRTTNWAIVITASVITFAFSSAGNPHFVLLGGIATVTIFAFIEARRYRMYDVWRSRVRLLEENVFAEALDPEGVEHPSWREMLSEDLREPAIKVPFREALSRRLRRVYVPLLVLLLLAWIARITAFRGAGIAVLEAAGIAQLPGLVVVVAVFAFYWVVFALVLWPMRRRAKGKLDQPERPPDWTEDEEN